MSENLGGKVTAPFTPDQVASLNAYQQSETFHPFTCGRDECREANPDASLAPAEDGWHCTVRGCRYRQDWAHGFMADWTWRTHVPVAPSGSDDTANIQQALDLFRSSK